MLELVLFSQCQNPTKCLFDDLLFYKKWLIPNRVIQDPPKVGKISRSEARKAAREIILGKKVPFPSATKKDWLDFGKKIYIPQEAVYIPPPIVTVKKIYKTQKKIYKTHDSLGRPIPKRDANGKFLKSIK